MQRHLTTVSASNHFKLNIMSCYVHSSLATFPSKNPSWNQRCMIHYNASDPRLDLHMFNFASHFKPWIKFAIQNKQTRVVVARSQQKERHWKDREKIFQRPWKYWKYSMLLIPSLLELQTACHNTCQGRDNDPPKTHQIKAFNRADKLGFVGDHVAMVESIHLTLGWLEVAAHVHTRVASKNDDENKESNEDQVRAQQ